MIIIGIAIIIIQSLVHEVGHALFSKTKDYVIHIGVGKSIFKFKKLSINLVPIAFAISYDDENYYNKIKNDKLYCLGGSLLSGGIGFIIFIISYLFGLDGITYYTGLYFIIMSLFNLICVFPKFDMFYFLRFNEIKFSVNLIAYSFVVGMVLSLIFNIMVIIWFVGNIV